MTRYLYFDELLHLYRRVVQVSGGSMGVHRLEALQSALAQPLQAFAGEDLYLTLAEKVGALGYFLIANHPFVDGNKRIGHAAMELFLLLNGYEIAAPVDEQELVILQVARGELRRAELTAWLAAHVVSVAR